MGTLIRDSYQKALARGEVTVAGVPPTPKQWRCQRRGRWVREYRAAIAADPELAATKLLEYLAGGGWQNRKVILSRSAIKRAAVLTAAIERLVSLGKVEVKLCRAARGGYPCTFVRLKQRAALKRAA